MEFYLLMKHTLCSQENKDDFGKEAVATLIKRMEDDRDKLIVILAGYTQEMKSFIDTNPGLKSRFNRYIEFEDYSPEELEAIYKLQCGKLDYILTPDADIKPLKLLQQPSLPVTSHLAMEGLPAIYLKKL